MARDEHRIKKKDRRIDHLKQAVDSTVFVIVRSNVPPEVQITLHKVAEISSANHLPPDFMPCFAAIDFVSKRSSDEHDLLSRRMLVLCQDIAALILYFFRFLTSDPSRFMIR
ncbi:hypothetical protein SDC9_147093 [bioreactor metagenome]|uniref:Uncharacterized protein n=1 Tax=bioreactor metagenome TaxID=1076179 RepID=A0A645EFL2_9ZZZZ